LAGFKLLGVMRRGIASAVIGVVGLLVITYSFYQTEKSYVDPGETQHLVALYAMSWPARLFLFIVEAAGVLLGYFAYRSGRTKLGLLGMGLCALCLIVLYGYIS
jgi:hypothetical protein